MECDKPILSRDSKVGTFCRLDEYTDVLKLPRGVLVRTFYSSADYNGGYSTHTVYLSDDEYFGKETH